MLRAMKIVLVLSVAVFGLVGAFGNIGDWAGTKGAVAATTSMATFEGGPTWRATSNPAVILTGAVLIPLFKTIGGLLCLAGAWRMWSARAADAAVFGKAKSLALAGCMVLVFMLFAGWIVIAETWFELWRSDVMRSAALESAFRYAGFVGLIALIVGAREE